MKHPMSRAALLLVRILLRNATAREVSQISDLLAEVVSGEWEKKEDEAWRNGEDVDDGRDAFPKDVLNLVRGRGRELGLWKE